MMGNLALKILKELRDDGGFMGGYRNLGESKHIPTQAALNQLVDNGYVSAAGSEWETAIFSITEKGKTYLAELEIVTSQNYS